jgi:hypothetical protein
MNLQTLSPQSKTWVYQSSKPFTIVEVNELNVLLADFAKQWTAHNQQLQAAAFVFEDRFLVFMVDETMTNASGCSIDKSVHFLKTLEKTYQTELFNRMLVNYTSNGKITTTKLFALDKLLAAGLISKDTLVYDPLVNTKHAFDEKFLIPLNNSWVKNFVSLHA